MASPKGPDFTEGIPLDQLEEARPFLGHVNGEPVILVRRGEDVDAIGARCTHYGGPLAKGLVVGDTVRCPWHHACFSLKTGQALDAPALSSVPTYEVHHDGPNVRVGKIRHPERFGAPIIAPTSVVTVGAGAAASACARMLRAEGYDGPITLIGDELPGPVDRPQFSKGYLAGSVSADAVPLGDEGFWRGLDVELILDDPVTVIDREARKVRTRGGRDIAWDALLYATGSSPRRPSMEGLDETRHYLLRTMSDCEAIIRAATNYPRALIVGSSFIGLETAAALRQRDVDVTVVGLDENPLEGILGPDVSRLIRAMHEEQGVKFALGTTVARFSKNSARLDNGDDVPFDFVILGVGVTPRLDLARAADLDVEDGVIVDAYMRTSVPGIWAAGDVAQFPDIVSGHTTRIEHWVVAERQGQYAARNMLGANRPFRQAPFFWTRQYDTSIQYVGNARGWDRLKVSGSVPEKDALIAYMKRDRILAVAAIGRGKAALKAAYAFQQDDQQALHALFL